MVKEETNNLLINAFYHIELNETKHSKFFEAWKTTSFKRGGLITEAGTIEKHFYVVKTGVQAIYILTPKGDKKVIGFSYDGSFSGVYDSFLTNAPSHYFLEAITDSELYYITKSDYDSFFQHYPEFNTWGRLVHQDLLIGRVNREVELITKTAKERFDAFSKRCPQKLLEIPQKLIASYLKMSPETYSRMRAQL